MKPDLVPRTHKEAERHPPGYQPPPRWLTGADEDPGEEGRCRVAEPLLTSPPPARGYAHGSWGM